MRKVYLLVFIFLGFISNSNGQATLSTDPTSLDFGSVCLNATPMAKLTINGTNLTSEDISVGQLPGYTYSTTLNGTYTTTLTLTPSGVSYAQDIYVKFSPTAVQLYNGSISISGGGAATINVSVTGSGLANQPVNVSITANAPLNTVCQNTPVTFTATPTNEGTSPVYQWQVGGVNVGSNSSTYTTSTLTNGKDVRVILTSNAVCATGNPATSNIVVMNVNPNLPASVSIAASATTICAGTSVTFTATPTNGGTAPTYQWKVNGGNVGGNSPTYTTITLTNGQLETLLMTSNAICATGSPATSNIVTMNVNPNLPASVSIAASATTICAGTSVTFTATPTNPGTTPTYQWKVNGTNAGSNSPIFTSTTLTDNDVVTVVMTSNATCATGSPATSNAVTMNVNPNLPASVSIAASATTICAGTSVTFTATPTNGGTAPTYQWKVNGGNVGGNSPTYTTSTLTNGQTVTVVMTSNATCATGSPATSNSIPITVNPNLPVSVSIASNAAGNTICSGTSVTFIATPTNGGNTPFYQWKVNGTNAGSNSPIFTSTTLTDNDVVTVVMTSNATCATGSPATSNAVTMNVNPNLPASVSIAASATTICAGTSVTFTATPTNGGTAPTYQWKVNGGNVGGNSPTYTTSTLTNGQTVTVVMTSNATCATGSPATSNSIPITVNPNLPVSVSIASNAAGNTICSGTSVTFTATPTNGGNTPFYQWKVNGTNAGSNSPIFTSTTLTDNDVVTVVMTSNATCATGSPATSNAVTMNVNPNLPASVSIAASATTICAGTSVTFTATPTNGGTAPTYQWKV